RLRLRVDESGRLQRLDAVVRPAAVVTARILALKNVESMAACPEGSCSCAERRSSTRQAAVVNLSNALTNVEWSGRSAASRPISPRICDISLIRSSAFPVAHQVERLSGHWLSL